MNDDDLWELAGPRIFARRVEDAMRERSNVLVPTLDGRAPKRLGSGLKSIFDAVQQYHRLSETSTEASLEALRAAWDTGEGSTICDYCKSIGSVTLILVVNSAASFPTWVDFMMRWQDVTRQIGHDAKPCLVVIGQCPASAKSRLRPDVALRIVDWEGVVTLADIESLALARISREVATGTLRRILARIVAEVSHGDVSLATYLAGRPPSEIAWPQESIRRWYQDSIKHQLCVPDEIWFDGSIHPHPASVAQTPRVIRDWVWRAQSSILMPWADAHRQRHLGELSGRLALVNAFGEPVPTIDELEIGEIYHQLTAAGCRDDAQRFFARLREMRNRMAHRAPFSINELKSTIAFIESFTPIAQN